MVLVVSMIKNILNCFSGKGVYFKTEIARYEMSLLYFDIIINKKKNKHLLNISIKMNNYCANENK